MRKYFLLFVMLAIAVATVGSTIYKWVDEKGVAHYSETPPSGKKVDKVDISPPPPKEVTEEAQRKLQRLREELRQRDAEREEATKRQEETEAAANREALARKQRCILARQNLHTLQMQRAVYSINGKGERVFLDDKTRAAEIERMKKEVESYCGLQ